MSGARTLAQLIGAIQSEAAIADRSGQRQRLLDIANDLMAFASAATADASTQIYTVRRSPYTAAAKSSAGYGYVDFEYAAESGVAAIDKAVADCEWRDPRENFRWNVVGTRLK